MKMKKGLVFDSKQYFANFLKYEFKSHFVFDSYKDLAKFEGEIEQYNFMFFMIYDTSELLNLIQLHKRGIPLIVSTLDAKIKSQLEKLESIIFFDSTKIKSEMRVDLKFCLNMVA